MDLKRWRIPMALMMTGAGLVASQGTQAASDCYECAWTDEVCRLMTPGEGDWGSTSCVGENNGFDQCMLGETRCTG